MKKRHVKYSSVGLDGTLPGIVGTSSCRDEKLGLRGYAFLLETTHIERCSALHILLVKLSA